MQTQAERAMASSDGTPGPMPSKEDGTTPGKEMTVGQHMLDKGALMLQSFKPINKFNYHLCTFALYSHDLSRQIQTHHFMSRLNQDFCQCAVYDSDAPSARLIGSYHLPNVLVLKFGLHHLFYFITTE